MSQINIGDFVVIRGSNNYYGITKDGSTGTVENIVGDYIYISFNFVTGRQPPTLPRMYGIQREHVLLVQQAPTNYKKKTRLEIKIEQMWNRQPYMEKHHAKIS